MGRTASRGGRVVELTAKEFALLEYLMQARGRICLRSDLLRDVWHTSPSAGTNVVDVYVNYLRKKLSVGRLEACGEVAGERVIETVRGIGYRMSEASIRGPLPAGVLQTSLFEPVGWVEGRLQSA